jgi:hypothetical protein
MRRSNRIVAPSSDESVNLSDKIVIGTGYVTYDRVSRLHRSRRTQRDMNEHNDHIALRLEGFDQN